MAEDLASHGLYFDDMYALRVLDPDVASETTDLKDECSGYTESKCLTIFLFFKR